VFVDTTGGLTTVQPDGSGAARVAIGHDLPRWSTDGTRIAMRAEAPDGRVTTALIGADGSGFAAQPLTDGTLHLSCTAWSPDDLRLACEGWDISRLNRPAGVFAVRAGDGQKLVRLTANPYGGRDVPGDYSPDGERIVFTRQDPRRPDAFALFTVRAKGGRLEQITPWGGPDCCRARWSPDGSRILYAGRGKLYVVRPDGTDPHPITLPTRDEHLATQPGWSPDGKRIVFAMMLTSGPLAGVQGIYTANANGAHVRTVVTTRTGFLREPDWGLRPVPR
jgi:dipeptidyl aminopeptidase/acylaminoacyl peptidase